MKYVKGSNIICTDREYLMKIYKEAGNPGVPVHKQNIHWIPYKTAWNKDYVFNFTEYDPLIGSNYTYVYLKDSLK